MISNQSIIQLDYFSILSFLFHLTRSVILSKSTTAIAVFYEIRFPMPKTENSRSLAEWIEHDQSGAPDFAPSIY